MASRIACPEIVDGGICLFPVDVLEQTSVEEELQQDGQTVAIGVEYLKATCMLGHDLFLPSNQFGKILIGD